MSNSYLIKGLPNYHRAENTCSKIGRRYFSNTFYFITQKFVAFMSSFHISALPNYTKWPTTCIFCQVIRDQFSRPLK